MCLFQLRRRGVAQAGPVRVVASASAHARLHAVLPARQEPLASPLAPQILWYTTLHIIIMSPKEQANLTHLTNLLRVTFVLPASCNTLPSLFTFLKKREEILTQIKLNINTYIYFARHIGWSGHRVFFYCAKCCGFESTCDNTVWFTNCYSESGRYLCSLNIYLYFPAVCRIQEPYYLFIKTKYKFASLELHIAIVDSREYA